jgi:fermentation-respiration switch protein FrsA (DUF1100 family)
MIGSIKLTHILFLFLSIGALSYLGLIGLLYFTQSRYVYHPESRLEALPSDIGLTFEEVSLVTKDDVRLSGWYIPCKESRLVILFCHGNAGNISHRLNTLQIFNRLGISTLIFDYRGYGASEGQPSEIGTYRDAEAAWQYLLKVRYIPPRNIVVFGRSLGGAIAAHLAGKHQPSALILESTFISFKEIASDLYPYLPVGLITRFSYNTFEYLRNVKVPVLIVHSLQDELIPFRHGQVLYDAVNGPKELLLMRGDHSTGFLLSEGYAKGLHTFLERSVKNRDK